MYQYTAYTTNQDGETFEHDGPIAETIKAAARYAHEAFPAWEYKGYGPRIKIVKKDTGELVYSERC